MNINFIDLTGMVDKSPTVEDLLLVFNNKVRNCDNASIRYDIICSLFRQRKRFFICNEVLTKFINKFKPKVFCVYKLLLGDEVVYVGSSHVVEDRIVTHTSDKEFDRVLVCVKDTKEEMLNTENYLIDHFKPKYNKSANIARVKAYGNLCEKSEDFIRLEDYLVELPIRKNSGNRLYDFFEGSSFKYGYDTLSSNGKHKITSYFIQDSNTVLDYYKPTGKITPRLYRFEEDKGSSKTLIEMLEGLDLGRYVVECRNVHCLWCFDDKYIFSEYKWRVNGRDKWYKILDYDRFISMLKEHVDSKYGEVTVPINPIFTVGKYRNRTVGDIIIEDPDYISWVIRSFEKQDLISLGLMDKDFNRLYETASERLYKSLK